MKNFKYLCTFLLLCVMSGALFGQVQCIDLTTVVLGIDPADPSIELHAIDLISNPEDYPDVECSMGDDNFGPTITLTCSDLGVRLIKVRPAGGSQSDECTVPVKVIDNIGPVVIVEPDVQLILNGPVVTLLVDQVDEGSYDNCDISAISLSQTEFSTPGEYTVTMTITDSSGNQNQAFTTVTVTQGNGDPIVCSNMLNVSLGPDGLFELNADIILEQSAVSNYEISVIVNGTVSPNGSTLDCTMVGKQVQVQITDLDTGNSCSSVIVVEDKLPPVVVAQNVSVSLSDEYCTPSTGNLTFIAENKVVVPGQSICVSILTRNFDAIQAGTGTVLWDPNVIRYTGLTNASLPGIEGSFNASESDNGIFKFLWTNPNPATGLGLADDTAIFDLCFDGLGTLNETTDIELSTEGNLNFEWFDEDLDTEVELTLVDGVVAVGGSNNGATPLVVPAGLVTAQLFDNCTLEDVSITPSAFTEAGTYAVTITATDLGGNTATAQSTVTVASQSAQEIECIPNTVIVSNPWPGLQVDAIDFVANPDDFTTVAISRSLDGPYAETLIFECHEAGLQPLTVFIKGSTATSSYICCSEVIIQDDAPPVAIANQTVTAQLVSGIATITTDQIDNGSYDTCSDVELSLDKTQFTSADIGSNTVLLTVTDQSGNSNQTFSTVIVIDGTGDCTLSNVTFPSDISITSPGATIDDLSVDQLQDQFGYDYSEVHPIFPPTCDNFAATYSDQVFNSGGGLKVLRTFTVLDWITGTLASDVQIIRLNVEGQMLACVQNVSVSLSGGSISIFVEDILEGEDYDYSLLSLVITDQSGNVVTNNQISPNYAGQVLDYTITDAGSGNSCFGEISVIDDNNGCPITEDDIQWPLPVINVELGSNDPDDYTPENLIALYGFTPSETRVNIANDCAIAGYVYEDEIIQSSSAYQVFIVRTWTVVDWLVFQNGGTTGIFEYTQIIKGGLDATEFICDILPNTAPVGDCDTGHTLQDDVEWPADLMIADYRLSPEDLVTYSSVEPKDAQPIFYNDPTRYEATYVDLLIDLSPSTITLSRLWTAEHQINGLTWNYTQSILVDITDFENLVTVSTTSNRNMQGVMINDQFVTNQQGRTDVEGNITTIGFDDEIFNGINVRDLILIQRHILGLENMTDQQVVIADVDEDGQLKASDLTQLRKLILGIIEQPLWQFNDINQFRDAPVKPKATFVAYKLGDVDDNAIVNDSEQELATEIFEVQDLLLNNGETYTVPVKVNKEFDILGFDLRFKIDSDLIRIDDVTSVAGNIADYNVNEELFFVMYSDPFDVYNTGQSDGVIANITFTALGNGLLNDAFDLDAHNSYLVDDEINLIVLGGELDGMIGTGVNSKELISVTAYPNPTADYLHVDLSSVEVQGSPILTVYGLQGQKLLSQGGSTIDVSNLPPGQYYYQVEIDQYQTVGKFIVTK